MPPIDRPASRTVWNREALIVGLAVAAIALHLVLRVADADARGQAVPLYGVLPSPSGSTWPARSSC